MKKILKPHIKLKELLDEKDYADIEGLQKLCLETDKTTLKLEIDYKLSRAKGREGAISRISEFMYYDDDKLIGYMGICQFGGKALEVNGMVHPEYRRQGIFKILYTLVKDEFSKRDVKTMLLLSDRNSISGQEFIKTTGAVLEHSEYDMALREEPEKRFISSTLALRKASNSDARELAYQDAIYFGDEYDSEETVTPDYENMRMPEEEEKHGTIIYVAEVDDKIVGKVNIGVHEGVGGIYGLGVLPEFRSKGYGREILMGAVEKLKEVNAREIVLQVLVKNKNALNLYKSSGFVETSIMDYFEITK